MDNLGLIDGGDSSLIDGDTFDFRLHDGSGVYFMMVLVYIQNKHSTNCIQNLRNSGTYIIALRYGPQ